ncbi:MAG: hypothetical protein IPJ92_03730 [Veillonella sp.]|nr:hypothetical protein [Veillonella sp.]
MSIKRTIVIGEPKDKKEQDSSGTVETTKKASTAKKNQQRVQNLARKLVQLKKQKLKKRRNLLQR